MSFPHDIEIICIEFYLYQSSFYIGGAVLSLACQGVAVAFTIASQHHLVALSLTVIKYFKHRNASKSSQIELCCHTSYIQYTAYSAVR